MNSNPSIRPNLGRFAALFSRDGCPRPLYDEILFEKDGCVVTPTLGSIVPNWLLVIPRIPVINFVGWQVETGAKPAELIQAILRKHDIATNRAIWFEHGPTKAGSQVGCGVDQAHLHLIIDAPFSFQDFVSAAEKAGQFSWEDRSAATAHGTIKRSASYLIAASMDRAVTAENVERVGSQFFRRVVATLIRQPDAWNYRTHPHLCNVQETIRTFSGQAA